MTGKRCPHCGASWELFPPARVDEYKPEANTFGPSEYVRCIGCKDTFHRPIDYIAESGVLP